MKKDKNLATLIKFLFLLDAVKVAPPTKPFWYTSGLFGPLYINTHFLLGGEKSATDLLNYIDLHKEEKKSFPQGLLERLIKKYKTSKCYRLSIDLISKKIQKKILDSNIDLISGGERRDWFFSLMVAYKLKLKTLLLYKDKSSILFDTIRKEVSSFDDLLRGRVLHIADLTTFASSYVRFWIPSTKLVGCKIKIAFNVADRCQGASKEFKQNKIMSMSLIDTNLSFFKEVMRKKLITKKQLSVIREYFKNPDVFIKNFIKKNPRFIKDALASSDRKTRERARLFISKHAKKYLN